MSKILTDEFYEKVKEDLHIREISKENLENLGKQHYYLQLLTNKKYQLTKLQEVFNAKYQIKYNYFKFEYERELRAGEIDQYTSAELEVRESRLLCKEVETEIYYLEQVVKAFHNRNFVIKNAVELLKLEN